jgi:hypothetical protein
MSKWENVRSVKTAVSKGFTPPRPLSWSALCPCLNGFGGVGKAVAALQRAH